MTTELTWTGSPDDQTAICGEYTFRIEKLDFALWWWSFLKDGDEILWGDSFSEPEAKTACEKAYYEHLKSHEV